MSKNAKLDIAGAVVIIMVLAWVLLPGLQRCWAYYRLSSGPSMLAVLSVKPSRIELPVPLSFKWGRWKEKQVHPAARRVAREMMGRPI